MAANKDQGRLSPPAIGGASLLVVFAVLCLTVFALLSLSTVRADEHLSQISARSVEGYYAADCTAQEVLAPLRSGQKVTDTKVRSKKTDTAGETLYSYACPISDTQTLEVEVTVREGSYTVLRWQAVPSGDWSIDESLSVWTGDSEEE